MLTSKSRLPVREILLYGFLPPPLKRWVYRLLGYRVGKSASIGWGSVVIGRDVEIGNHTSIGFFSVVRGETIKIGAHVQIGSATILDVAHLEIGEGTKINEQVFVGGLQFPDSRFVVGRNCQIMQMTFINPSRSIVIGDDSGVGGDCMLFGHTSWQSKFEGYPVHFDSIEIGRSVSIAWRVFLLPGSKVGDGSVIGANSLVRGTIPPRSMAVGFPARVVKSDPEFPERLEDGDRERILREIIAEMGQYLCGSGFEWREEDGCFEVAETRGKGWTRKARTWRLAVKYEAVDAEQIKTMTTRPDVLLCLRRLSQEGRAACDERGILWVDIESKERTDAMGDLCEEVVQYLRRYGVRFIRVPVSSKSLAS